MFSNASQLLLHQSCDHRDVTAQVLPVFILARRIILLELYGRSPGIEVLVDVAIVIVTTSSVAISTCITATNLLAKVLCLVDVRSLSYPKTSPKVLLLLIAPHHHTAAAGGLVGK
jgi:hypothetical protein